MDDQHDDNLAYSLPRRDTLADEESDLKKLQEEELLKSQAPLLGFTYINLKITPLTNDALGIVPEDRARRAYCAGFKIINKDLHIAIRYPSSDEWKNLLAELQKTYTVHLYLASIESLNFAWSHYEDISRATRSRESLIDISEASIQEIESKVSTNADIIALFKTISEQDTQRITRMLEILMGSAIATKSSDIHAEPTETNVRIRYRQDGVLQDVLTLSHETYKQILSRIKVLSKLKITRTTEAQDGRFSIKSHGKDVEVRVSTVPSAYGESLVMRVLDPDGLQVDLTELGFNKTLLPIIQSEIIRPDGLILTCGPTGSGKTTTLYSFLKQVYSPDSKIITIEDPIEYHLDGIEQTQVDTEKGYTFLLGLRSALRQDPDIIMVGEIRDGETAQTAINASLAGHMVFSTLHTNSAAGAIPRLLDLKVSGGTLRSSLQTILAQRLVRKLCPHCKEAYKASEHEMDILKKIITNASPAKNLSSYLTQTEEPFTLYKHVGCPQCDGTGYKGRIGIFEGIQMTHEIENLLENNNIPSERDVWYAAREQGILTMGEDGVVKLLNGVTSYDEVERVVDLTGYGTIYDAAIGQPTGSSVVSPTFAQMEHHIEASPDVPTLTETSTPFSLLLNYLELLITEQTKNPTKNATHQIELVKKALGELQQQNSFTPRHNDTSGVQELGKILNFLDALSSHQQQNPHIGVEQELENVKLHLSDLQK